MASQSDKTTVAYIVVTTAAEKTANRTLRGINPEVSNAVLVDTLHEIGELQSHSVEKYSRQDQYEIVQ